MADDLHYVPGSFYRICDRTGFKIRAERTEKEWNNLIVRVQSFEERQPQDFVRGVADEQFVPNPRPRQTNEFLGPLTTQTTLDIVPGEVLVPVQVTTRMADGDTVEIMMANGIYFVTTILHVISNVIFQVTDPFPWFSQSGSEVVDTSAQTTAYIG